MPGPRDSAKKALADWGDVDENDDISVGDALISFFLKRDPDTLDDDEWARAVKQVQYGLKVTRAVHGIPTKSD